MNYRKILVIFIVFFEIFSMTAQGKKQPNVRKKLNSKVKMQVMDVLEKNEELHLSFFHYDGKKVESAAGQLKAAIEKIVDSEIAKTLSPSQKFLAEIKAAKPYRSNNKKYHLASLAFIKMINQYDLGSKYNAYSCPMVRKKWVQNSEKMARVHNPYDKSMPHCGSQDTHY